MPTPFVTRRRTMKPRTVLAIRPGPQLTLILVLSLMVLAAGINRMAPPASVTWTVDIATP